MNALICVGCDHYDTAGDLTGAEADAQAVFELLTSANDPYNSAHATLLPSPTLPELRKALNDIFPLKTGIEGLTFFFAGHGGTVGGNFYLCVRDTQIDRLSTTAFPITQLFSIINEFKPPQVNIVVDACAAGGSSFDLGNLIKPEITGSSASSSVAFLGACGADQDAIEEGGHGVLTRELMRCLKGEIEVQRRAPLLDLVEVGAVVSPLVQSTNNSQRPLSWGLSLFGGSSFAKNPFFTSTGSDQHFPLPNISPFSSLGAKIRESSNELWEIHRNLPLEFNPRRLMRSLEPILKEAADAQERAAVVEGISSSLSARAVESEDLLAPALCHSTCLVTLPPTGQVQCVLSSLLFPDRIPFFVGETISRNAD